MKHQNPHYCVEAPPSEDLRLEIVVTCVGFDDILDHALAHNHPHSDTIIVATSHDDRRTHAVCTKHGAICVKSDLHKKNGRKFNKGALCNSALARFQYHGWRLHLDADILLPDNFRRMLFSHSHLDKNCIYGADRIDVEGLEHLEALKRSAYETPQSAYRFLLHSRHVAPASGRYVDPLHGYVPIGYFQLWHASCQKPYPWSLGTAGHDDVAFATTWPQQCRRLLPTALVYHLVPEKPRIGQNWEGRTSRRLY